MGGGCGFRIMCGGVMARIDAPALLRPGLLEGTSMLVGGAGGAFGEGVLEACSGLSARTARCELSTAPDAERQEEEIEAAVQAALDPGVGVLVLDVAALFARAGLSGSLQAAWSATRTVANGGFIADGAGGRVLLIAPAADAGRESQAAVAGLENLARTLSIEWARHAITAVAIAPGSERAGDEVAALAAYLASEAGAYFSGCLLDLRGPERELGAPAFPRGSA